MAAAANVVEAQKRRPRAVDSLTTASSSRSTSPGAFLAQVPNLDAHSAGALAFVVRNTFIDDLEMDARTDLVAQQPSSCPASKIGTMTLPASPPASPVADGAAAALRTYMPTEEEPAFGSPECPTVGSAGHSTGTCKPCAFLYTKGCASGVDCKFCHLCEPGEKKRRAKELKQQRRAEAERQAQDSADVNVPLTLDADSASDRCNNTLPTATPPPSPPSTRPPPLARRSPSYISTSTSSEEYAYVVRNTFIDFIDEAPLEDVLDDRRASFSCPGSRIGSVLIPEAEEYADFAASQIEGPVCWPSTPPPGEREACPAVTMAPYQSHCYSMLPAAFYEEAFLNFGSSLLAYVDDASAAPSADTPLLPSAGGALDAALTPASLAPEPSLADAAPASASRVLHLSEALPAPELGSPECPTRGSAGHHVGLCKPCAFFHKQGCGNGVQCEFCHLCDSGEKKRRQKEKKAQFRAMHAMETWAPEEKK